MCLARRACPPLSAAVAMQRTFPKSRSLHRGARLRRANPHPPAWRLRWSEPVTALRPLLASGLALALRTAAALGVGGSQLELACKFLLLENGDLHGRRR